MIEIRKTTLFAQWLDGLRDIQARARVQARIERLGQGNPGDVQPIGEGVSELRIHYGPIAFTSSSKGESWLFSGRRRQNVLRPETLRPRCASPEIFLSEL